MSLYQVQHEKRFSKIVYIVNSLFGGKGIRILDYGSHEGDLSIKLKNLGYKVTSCDLPEVINLFKHRYNYEELTTIELRDGKLPTIADGSYDCIILSEVLEHLWESPLAILYELKRLLKPDGMLI